MNKPGKSCIYCWTDFSEQDPIFTPDIHTKSTIERYSSLTDLADTARFKTRLFIVLAIVLFAALIALFFNISYFSLITNLHPISLSLISFAPILLITRICINLFTENKKTTIEKMQFFDHAVLCERCSEETRKKLQNNSTIYDPIKISEEPVKCFYTTTIKSLDENGIATNNGPEINFSKC